MSGEITLAVMAAGMGSRFKGMKQAEPITADGLSLLDFSVYDAAAAGFGRVVFIIKHDIEDDFRRLVGDRIASHIPVSYVFQEISDLPPGVTCPSGRLRPWGTGHAILCCRNEIREPFAVINADDYYGRHAFAEMAAFLKNSPSDFCMTGFRLAKTLTENGTVSRGICDVRNGFLHGIRERTRIAECRYLDDDGKTWVTLPEDTIVSMNLWGFTPAVFPVLEDGFASFLKTHGNDPQAEYYLPSAAEASLKSGQKRIRVFVAEDQWYGMTYRADLPRVSAALNRMREEGLYPGI